jgi:hypothetical protein
MLRLEFYWAFFGEYIMTSGSRDKRQGGRRLVFLVFVRKFQDFISLRIHVLEMDLKFFSLDFGVRES